MTILVNAMRFVLLGAAEVVPHVLRTHTLAHPPLATSPPSTLLLTLVTVAIQSP